MPYVKPSGPMSRALGVALLMLAATGCAANPPQPSAPSIQRQQNEARLQALLHRFAALRARARKPSGVERSWISRDPKTQDLIYVADSGTGNLHVYSYPKAAFIGKLGGFIDPNGLCTDAKDDIWVVDSGASKIIKFLHGGRQPKATLKAEGVTDLLACAVDPVSGDLAATTLGTGSNGGNVLVYTSAKGNAQHLQPGALQYVFFCGYDGSGNLFVDGLDKNYAFRLVELPAGKGTFQSVDLGTAIHFPGGIQWDGQFVAIGDQAYQRHQSAVYQFTIASGGATLEGTTLLLKSCDVLEFATSGGKLVAPDVCKDDASLYAYPAGGDPTKSFGDFAYPAAAAISLKQ